MFIVREKAMRVFPIFGKYQPNSIERHNIYKGTRYESLPKREGDIYMYLCLRRKSVRQWLMPSNVPMVYACI
jgi:hypothetical protein